MGVDGCGKIKKFILVFANVIIMLFGLALIILGILAAVGAAIPDAIKSVTAGAGSITGNLGIVLIIVGAATMVITFIGCIGAWKESYCLLFIYAAFLTLVLIVSLAGGIYYATNKDKVRDAIRKQMIKVIRKYNPKSNDTEVKKITDRWDRLQQEQKCCGINNWQTWWNETFKEWDKTVPDSCCLNKTKGCAKTAMLKTDPGKVIYTKGCLTKAWQALMSFGKLWIVALVYCVLIAIFILMSCCLAYTIRKNKKYEQV